jgi:hypothetical protein
MTIVHDLSDHYLDLILIRCPPFRVVYRESDERNVDRFLRGNVVIFVCGKWMAS